MDAMRRLRPVLAFSAGVLCYATAAAAVPCVGERCETPDGCSTQEECGSGAGSYGQSSRFGLGSCFGNGSGRGNDGPSRWSEEWYREHGHGPIGASQKFRAGKMWPPYPRPNDNAECSGQFHAAHYWPHPYNCWDRTYVHHILETQTARGWCCATTLYAYHFDAETNQLNDSGKIHLQWIVENVPQEHRQIIVQAHRDGEVSELRLASTQNEVAALGESAMSVTMQTARLHGRPANEVDAIRRAEMTSMPRPRVNVSASGLGTQSGKE